MTGWWAALAAAGAGAIAFLFRALKAAQLEGQVKEQTEKIKALEADVARREKQRLEELATWSGQIQKANEDKDRMEKVVSGLKGELSKMDEQLAACTDPKVIRDRINALFPGGGSS